MSFESLGLRAELMRALESAGYHTATPVQAQAIPVILEGRDVLAGAQTGTGKTAGFTLPLLQRLMESGRSQPQRNVPVANNRAGAYGRGPMAPWRPVRALVLTPTRELAAQVEESIRTYGKFLPLTTAVIFGGVGFTPQANALRRGVDIVVATPGRLLDHIGQRTLDLSRVETLVLDEADRMLDMGFINDIRKILNLLPNDRQNLLFSATFSKEIKTLADGLLNEPVMIEVARENQESELVAQTLYHSHKETKRELLIHLLTERAGEQALVFTRTKHGADRLAEQLQRGGIGAVPIHGGRSQGQRTRALADFKNGAARILVATDIAARGLDIPQLPFVINFELPNVPEDYVHRIGRTGRAGSLGEAISLVSPDERAYLADIEKLIQKRIERREAAGFAAPRESESDFLLPRPQQGRGAPGTRSRPGAQSRAPRLQSGGGNGGRRERQYTFPSGR